MHRYQGIAFRTACLVAGNAADAEEAAQDAFVKAYRALGRFRPGAPFRPGSSRSWPTRRATAAGRPAGARRSSCASPAQSPRGARPRPPETSVASTERRRELAAALGQLR